ncbi:DEAD/DEAH box helicase [Gordonia phthalatica]|uniref:DEAD/DEAH box helicase n=1 Tax=Gordonia phthalatica TaxID=1136941 RepID=UPI001D03F30C|nr:DEAD/DEAH box helicase [Gordonia phthalatica]
MSNAQLSLREWQREALDRWIAADRCAIVEAVTGTGKTTLGLAAAADALGRGVRVLVIVPGVDLVEQWYHAARRTLGTVRIGRRGHLHSDRFGDVDVLITTVQSAYRDNFEIPDGPTMCIADEVHRYGSDSFSRALRTSFSERLGLTATLERSDGGVEEKLLPFFGVAITGCDFRRARADGIIAPVRVMTVPVQFSAMEYSKYRQIESTLSSERWKLISEYGCRDEPFGLFLQDVQDLAKDGDYRASRSAGAYLHAFSARRELLASSQAKLKVLHNLGSVLTGAGRTLVFSETKTSAQTAADALATAGVYAESVSSSNTSDERARLLRRFSDGHVTALAAPKILDEGIDVPEADVGIIVAASSSRRQMIQRIGRIIRPKPDGRAASFIVLYIQGTIEDPARGAHESFLEQLTEIADQTLDVPAGDAVGQLANWLGQSMSEVESARAMPRVQALTAVIAGQDVVDPVRTGIVSDCMLAGGLHADLATFDLLLSCMSILSAQQIEVLLLRFGIDGGPTHSVREAAKALGLAPRAVVRIEDEALGRLENQDVLPILDRLSRIDEPDEELGLSPLKMPTRIQ